MAQRKTTRKRNIWPFTDKRTSARQTTPATGGIARHAKGRKPAAKKTAATPAFTSIKSEEALQHAFKRGLSLKEALAENPGLRAFKRANPAKFDRCVKAVQGKGGAANAYAVCTAAGTRNPRQVFTWDVMVGGEFFGTVEAASAAEAKRKGRDLTDEAWKGRMSAQIFRHLAKHGVNVIKRENPAAAADAAFEEFHGYPSKELVTVSKKIHRHEHLAAAGDLLGMKIKPVSRFLPARRLGGFKGAILAFNEAKNQLFIEGGDQFLSDSELRKFGIKNPHEVETLGKVLSLDYHTTKTHLREEGGTAPYVHKLRTTNKDGRNVVVRIARYPDLIYRVLDQQMEFSGGSYEIRAEGIDK